jgi:hypothetical protein
MSLLSWGEAPQTPQVSLRSGLRMSKSSYYPRLLASLDGLSLVELDHCFLLVTVTALTPPFVMRCFPFIFKFSSRPESPVMMRKLRTTLVSTQRELPSGLTSNVLHKDAPTSNVLHKDAPSSCQSETVNLSIGRRDRTKRKSLKKIEDARHSSRGNLIMHAKDGT